MQVEKKRNHLPVAGLHCLAQNLKAENNYSSFKEKKLESFLIWFFVSLEEL